MLSDIIASEWKETSLDFPRNSILRGQIRIGNGNKSDETSSQLNRDSITPGYAIHTRLYPRLIIGVIIGHRCQSWKHPVHFTQRAIIPFLDARPDNPGNLIPARETGEWIRIARVQISMAPRSSSEIIKWPRYIESRDPVLMENWTTIDSDNSTNRFYEFLTPSFLPCFSFWLLVDLRELF